MKRSDFIKSAWLGTLLTPASIQGFNVDPKQPLDKALVQEFVGAAHRDKTKVLALLEETPNLINAAHDWGSGDFETALGAASHVGYMELVTHLVDRGAQANIFTACLFGQINIVKLTLERFPKTLHAKGPHGFTLLHHAIQGGQDAEEVKVYLESLGAVETKIPLY